MITDVKKAARTLSGTATYTGTWGRKQVLHLLRRTLFGATEKDVDYFVNKSVDDAIDEILNVSSTPPSPPLNHYGNRVTDPDIALGKTWVNGPANGQLIGARLQSLKSWWIGEMVDQDSTILEKMTMFWHNHFATETSIVRNPIYLYNHHTMLRAGALGNFKTMVRDVTIDPAMLVYLNGQLNTKRAPDENYGRELQELFTVGKGPDSGYTEDDVKAAAHVLTGWRINRDNFTSFFVPNQHDTENKTFSSFYGNTVIVGQTGMDGANEVDDLITMIFKKDEVAKFLCRELYRWFVYYEIDEATETNVIEPLADVFIQNNYDIKPLLKALFTSEHFFDEANVGCVIKSPLDYGIGLVRQMGIEFPDGSDVERQYAMWYAMWGVAAEQQQNIGDPPSVSGWPAYYQIPLFHEIWINSDTLPKRNQITDLLISTGYRTRGATLIIDEIKVAEMFDKPGDPNVLIADLLEYLHTIPVSSDQVDFMKSLLLSGQNDDAYWTDAWDAYQADPGDTVKKNTVSQRIKLLLKYLMNLAEFQLS